METSTPAAMVRMDSPRRRRARTAARSSSSTPGRRPPVGLHPRKDVPLGRVRADHGDGEEDGAGHEDQYAAEEGRACGAREQLIGDGLVQEEDDEVQRERDPGEQAEADDVHGVRHRPGVLVEVEGGQRGRAERGPQAEDETGGDGLAGEDLDDRRETEREAEQHSADSTEAHEESGRNLLVVMARRTYGARGGRHKSRSGTPSGRTAHDLRPDPGTAGRTPGAPA
ncbi:hypothetical protein ACQP1W_36805 [Spirillospora sp. CA-255316]